MANLFHYRNGVGFFFRVHTQLDEVLKQFGGIGHIEITCNNKVSVHPIVGSKERVYGFHAISTESSVAHMTQEQLTYIRDMTFLCFHIIF